MATANKSYNSKYQFVNEIPNNYLCQQCKQIARGASTTSCCEKCLCVTCAQQVKENTESCLLCKQKEFWIEENLNYKDSIEALTIYCSLKDKGCGWTGPLQDFEFHLSNDCELNRKKQKKLLDYGQEIVQSEFNYAGCEDEFQQDQQKEHYKQTQNCTYPRQGLLDPAGNEKFQEPQGISGNQSLNEWSHIQELGLQSRYTEFELRINKKTEQFEQLLQEKEQQLRKFQKEARRDDNPPEGLYQPWTCSMLVAVTASVLIAVMLGLHFQSFQRIDPIDSPSMSPRTTGKDGNPDNNKFQEQLNELRLDISKLKESIQGLEKPTIDESASLDDFHKTQQRLEDSLEQLTRHVTDQYTLIREDYREAIENLETKIQESILRFSEAETLLQSRDESRDKKVEELALTVNGVRDLRGRVESIEQKINDMGAKVALLVVRLDDLKQKFNEIPHHPPRHHHPPHPHHHPPHHHHHPPRHHFP